MVACMRKVCMYICVCESRVYTGTCVCDLFAIARVIKIRIYRPFPAFRPVYYLASLWFIFFFGEWQCECETNFGDNYALRRLSFRSFVKRSEIKTSFFSGFISIYLKRNARFSHFRKLNRLLDALIRVRMCTCILLKIEKKKKKCQRDDIPRYVC